MSTPKPKHKQYMNLPFPKKKFIEPSSLALIIRFTDKKKIYKRLLETLMMMNSFSLYIYTTRALKLNHDSTILPQSGEPGGRQIRVWHSLYTDTFNIHITEEDI